MANKAKHAFGQLEKVDAALSAGTVDAYDILFLKDENGKPYVGWIDRDGNKVIVDDSAEFEALEEKITSKTEDISSLEAELATKADAEEINAELATKANADEVDAKIDEVDAKFGKYVARMYEVVKAPDGTLVDYDEQEIRIMIPADTDFATQENASSTGAENIFYIETRVYAPEGAVGFRTDVGSIAENEPIENFNGTYAGTDEFGRNYFILYQSVAYYDTESSAWVYYGAKSTTSHYVGWNQITEWYDVDGKKFSCDTIRINLSNEDCHFELKPYYVSEIEAKIAEISGIEIIEF